MSEHSRGSIQSFALLYHRQSNEASLPKAETRLRHSQDCVVHQQVPFPYASQSDAAFYVPLAKSIDRLDLPTDLYLDCHYIP